MAFLHEMAVISDIVSPFTNANLITGNWFGIFILMFVFFVSFTSLKLYATEKAFLASSTITFVIAVLLSPLYIVQPIWIIIPLIMMVVGFFATAKQS